MCTNISILRKSTEDLVITARTMDYVKRLPTSISFVPRGQPFPEIGLPDEIQWKNKYGFIGIGQLLPDNPSFIYSDGLNEEGLSAASLWLHCSKYQQPKPNTAILSNINFVNYVLGNFKTIKEVQEALSKITVADYTDYQSSIKFPMHYIITDSSGNHLIIEYIKGKIHTYTNQFGLLTNEPTFDWHNTNLGTYGNLSLSNKPNVFMGDELYGSGQIGCPGDSTPASRFVRGSLLQGSTFQPKNIQQSIGLAQQILQTLTIPCGTAIQSNNTDHYIWTQWSIIRDHTNCSIYFNTAFNSKLYGIHLKSINFETLKQKNINILQPEWYTDITRTFETINNNNNSNSNKIRSNPFMPFRFNNFAPFSKPFRNFRLH